MKANSLIANPIFHARTKHIDINVHFLEDKVLKGKLDVPYTIGADKVANIMTKMLPTLRFIKNQAQLSSQLS